MDEEVIDRLRLDDMLPTRQEELGGPLSPEEVLAFRDGRLSPERRRSIEARLVVDPEAAQALADLLAFPDVEPAPGTPEASDEEIEAGWKAFLRRLEELAAR
jgi:hypothetical protein